MISGPAHKSRRRSSHRRTDRIDRIIDAYEEPLVRLYCRIRFRIIHQRFLDEMVQYLPQRGRALEIGCGFGLFALYFAQTLPALQLSGVDLDGERIRLARSAARLLQISNATFQVGDARALNLIGQYDVIYMLDIVHHLPRDRVLRLLEQLWTALRPGGILLIKDVDTFPRRQMAFTWALDVVMTRGETPHYWSSEDLVALLRSVGFQVFTHAMIDLLPYPHRLYVCHRDSLVTLMGA